MMFQKDNDEDPDRNSLQNSAREAKDAMKLDYIDD